MDAEDEEDDGEEDYDDYGGDDGKFGRVSLSLWHSTDQLSVYFNRSYSQMTSETLLPPDRLLVMTRTVECSSPRTDGRR